MQWLGVQRHGRKQHVVAFGDAFAQRVLKHLSRLELLKIKAGHSAPPVLLRNDLQLLDRRAGRTLQAGTYGKRFLYEFALGSVQTGRECDFGAGGSAFSQVDADGKSG